eukprot:11739-Heterococcus_DN1.PRE.1
MCLSTQIRLCAALVLALLVQEVGSARQQEQQAVACPEETDLAYISCEKMHVATDGLNIFRQKFLRFLDAAYCQNRVAVMPKFRTVVGANDWIEFTDVFDIKPFAHYLFTKYNIHAVLSDCMPPNLQVAPHKRDCTPAKSNSLAVMPPPPIVNSYKAGPGFFAETLLAMQPAPHLNALVHNILRKIGDLGFVCLHLRTE